MKITQNTQILTWVLALYGILSLISMATMSIGQGIALAFIFLYFGGPRKLWKNLKAEIKIQSSRAYLYLSLALTATCALSLISALIHPLTYAEKFPEIHFLKDISKAYYLFIPLLLSMSFRQLTPRQLNLILKAWIITFGILAVIGIIQFYTGWPRARQIPVVFYEVRYHAVLFMGHHLSVASIMIFPFFAVLEFLRRGKSDKQLGIPQRALYLIAVLGVIMLILTFSRTFWIALPIGVLFWFFLSYGPKKTFYLFLLIGLVGYGATYLTLVQKQISRIVSNGFYERSETWETNWNFFKSRPIFGAGWRKTQELSVYYYNEKTPDQHNLFIGHAHNNFLEMLASTGIAGSLTWLLWCLYVLYLLERNFKNKREYSFAIGMFCAWITFHINGITQVNFWDSKVLHQITWVVGWTLLWTSSRVTKSS